MLRILLSFISTIFFYVFLCLPISHATEGNPEEQFRQAITWYYLARSTENSYVAHQKARDLYQAVLDNPTSSSDMKEKAQRGLRQVRFRLNSSHNIYRNLFDTVWWITEADPTIDWYGDAYSLSLKNALTDLNAYLEREIETQNYAVLALVGRNSQLKGRILDSDNSTDQQEEQEKRLHALRDELIGYAEGKSALIGIPDDVFPIDINWTSNPTITSEQIYQIADKMNAHGVVVLRANIEDEIASTTDHLSIVRTSLSSEFWKIDHTKIDSQGIDSQAIEKQEAYATITSVGIAQGALERKTIGILWIVIPFFLIIIVVDTYIRYIHETTLKRSRIFWIGLTCYFLGGFWSNLTFTFAQDYQVSWSLIAYYHEWSFGAIPYLPSFQWALVFSFVALIGPILMLIWIQSRAGIILSKLIPNRKTQMLIILPILITGVLTWTLFPLVVGNKAEGPIIGTILITTILFILALSLQKCIQLLHGTRGMNDGVGTVIAMMIILGMSLSLGFFGLISSYIIFIPLVIYGWNYFSRGESMVVEQPITKIIEVSDNPFHQVKLIESEKQIVKKIMANINSKISVCMERHGFGNVGRIMNQVHQKLQQENSKHTLVLHVKCNSSDEEPFALINRMFSRMGFHSHIQENTDKQDGNIVADSLDSILGNLPGVEFVMGFIDTGNDGLTREVMIQDAVELFCHGTHKSISTMILMFENAQHIDEASRIIIQKVMLAFNQSKSAERRILLIWDTESHKDCPLIEEQTIDVKFHKISLQDTDISKQNMSQLYQTHVQEFVSAYHIKTLTNDFIKKISDLSNGDLQKIQNIFAHLFEEKHVQQTLEGTIIPAENFSEEDLLKTLPSEYEDVEIKKLQHFTEKQQNILKCASICGDIIYAEEISQALDTSKIDVLNDLNKIEQVITPPILEDVPREPRIFQFRVHFSREVFSTFLQYSNGDPNELACAYHKRIVEAGINNELKDIPLSRQVEHAILLRDRAIPQLLTLLVRYFSELLRKRAWPEIMTMYKKHYQKFEKMKQPSEIFDFAKMNLIYAHALKNNPKEGSQEMHHREAILHLNKNVSWLTKLSSEQQFYFIKEWCDILYANATKSNKELFQNCIPLTQIQLNEIPWMYVESYRLTVLKSLQKVAIWEDLHNLVKKLDEMSTSPEQEYALGRILKEYAWDKWKCWFFDPMQQNISLSEKQIYFRDEIQPLFTRANTYMKHQDDYGGIAVSYGQQGSIFLLDLHQYDLAEAMYQRDLNIVQEYHFVGYESSTLNRLGLSILKRLCNEWGTIDEREKVDRFERIKKHVGQAINIAQKRHETINYVFAVKQLLDTKAVEYHHSATIRLEKLSDTLCLEFVELLNHVDWDEVKNTYIKDQWISFCSLYPEKKWAHELLDAISKTLI